MVKHAKELLNAGIFAKKFVIFQVNVLSAKKSLWKKVVVNVVEKKEALAVTVAKKSVIQASHVLKNHVKLKSVYIVNVVTALFKPYANQA